MVGTSDAAGRVIAGRYRLLRSLGAGGMGRVWLAHDQELACDVALKEIAVPPELPEPALNARIARARSEARHAARLRGNPHVVTVYDSVIDHGLPWLVMEYVPGARDLEAVVRDDGPLPPADTARMGLALLDALAAGHQLGILHRDVKPSNVLLTSTTPQEPHDTAFGRVLLGDYGISVKQDVDEPRLTTASGIVGTPGYLAPERARGAEPTPASDLFSLGATLYYAAEGQSPFDRGSYAATLTALLTEEPTPPRRAGNLTSVLLSLLAKDPAQRLDTDTATYLLTKLTAESPRSQKVTITQPVKPSSRPQPPTPKPGPQRSHSPGTPKKTRSHRWEPRLPHRAPGQQKTSTKRRIIPLTAAGLLLTGGGTWAVVTGLNGPHRPSPRTTPSGRVMPYGEAVGLNDELNLGVCVNASWTSEKFNGLPYLGITNCTGPHDGQVLNYDPSSSLDDAQKGGDSRCKMLLAETVGAMADARSYAIPPSKQGWYHGVQNTVCLIFNKTVPLADNVSQFRKFGQPDDISITTIGDCWRNINSNAILTQCGTTHDGQTVGFVRAPNGMTYKSATTKEDILCQNKYGSTYAHGNYSINGSTPAEEDWKAGFRYIQCDVVSTDGKPLTFSVVTSPPSTQPSR
ncbi:serine/threonine-protein kinase [Streptomyces sp. NPDC014991]|uniref:serine/threonine-protein kinase n=1 Tax=Streptomyces sp. NPDC014991 TaxID=3364935 RepID=UPI0036FE8C6C